MTNEDVLEVKIVALQREVSELREDMKALTASVVSLRVSYAKLIGILTVALTLGGGVGGAVAKILGG